MDFSSRKTLKYLHIIFGGAQAPPYIPVIKETKEMSVEYTNRYNDVYTFTKQENGDVLWEGSFKWCRFGWPNVYKEAYEQYRKDGGDMHIEQFKVEVHNYDRETYKPSEIAEKYRSLVHSDMNTIDMVDPSGGPYMTSHMDLGSFLGEEFEGRCIREFKPIEEGYLIITYDKYEHLAEYRQIGGIINYPENE